MNGTVVGYVGNVKDLVYTTSGTPVFNFSVGENVYVKDAENRTVWYDVAVFGKKAEFLADKVKTGAFTACHGRAVPELGKNGAIYVKFVANEVDFKNKDYESAPRQPAQQPSAPPVQQQQAQFAQTVGQKAQGFQDDSIPW